MVLNEFYTGIGSRKTNKYVCMLMGIIAELLSEKYILRSGGAIGADSAFESKAKNKDIYVIHDKQESYYINPSTYYNYKDAIKIVNRIHPKPSKLSKVGMALHARNCYQILGCNLSTPSKFVILYAPIINSYTVSGGTNTAYQLALENNIPTFNLYDENIYNDFLRVCESTDDLLYYLNTQKG